MKTTTAALTILAVAITILLPNNAFASNNPIPGIDVVVKKKPAGNAMKTSTDKTGKFAFSKLEAGTYLVTITPAKADPSPAKAAINTTRSQIKRPNGLVVNGVEVIDLTVSLGTTAPEPVKVVLEKDGGTISGTVTSAEAPKEVEKKRAVTGEATPAKVPENYCTRCDALGHSTANCTKARPIPGIDSK